MVWLRGAVARTTEEGSIASVQVASAPALASVGGRYFEDRCINDLCNATCLLCDRAAPPGVRPSSLAESEELRRFVWDTADKLASFPRVW